jgi:hypothetical protein
VDYGAAVTCVHCEATVAIGSSESAKWFGFPKMCVQPPNKRLKLAARVDYGMNLSSARRSLSAIR